MATKHKKHYRAPPLKKRTFNWKKLTRRSLILLSFAAMLAIPLYFFYHQSKIEHDLASIGNGHIASIVQIYDSNCQLCSQLKRNVLSVHSDFKDKVQFKIANIGTTKGRRFANKYNAPHVTLLFFDKKGDRINTIQGVSSSEKIEQALTALSRLR
jgi:thioredoxin-related protein